MIYFLCFCLLLVLGYGKASGLSGVIAYCIVSVSLIASILFVYMIEKGLLVI